MKKENCGSPSFLFNVRYYERIYAKKYFTEKNHAFRAYCDFVFSDACFSSDQSEGGRYANNVL